MFAVALVVVALHVELDERRVAVLRDLVARARARAASAKFVTVAGRLRRASTTSSTAARNAGSSTVASSLWTRTNSAAGPTVEAGVRGCWSARVGLADVGVVVVDVLRADAAADRRRGDDEREPAEDRGLPVARAPATHAGRDVRSTALERGEFVLDGELVAFDAQGRPSFQLLQDATSKDESIFYFIFDLLNRAGERLLDVPLARRRVLLASLLTSAKDPLRLSAQLQAPSGQIVQAIRQLGLEGVIGKRIDSIYEPGERSGAWVKYRTNQAQEFVIGGYIPGTRSFDALIVGVYEGKRLMFVAKVKNGFLPGTQRSILSALRQLETDRCPFANLPEDRTSRWGQPITAEKMKECRWVKPKLVCQVGFVEWTGSGHLRHSTFLGMRDDKPPDEVVRET